jgi:hypothetical protein
VRWRGEGGRLKITESVDALHVAVLQAEFEEAVGESLLDGHAGLRVLVQGATHEILGVVGNGELVREVEFREEGGTPLPLGDFKYILFEGTDLIEQFIHDGADFPEVDLLIVVVLAELFRTQVAGRANEGPPSVLGVDCAAEVAQLEVVLSGAGGTSQVKMFSGFRSRWITLCACMKAMAEQIW